MSGASSTQLRGPDAGWRRRFAAVAAGLLLVAANAQVQAPTTPVTDPVLDARVKALASELRCLVCQNQTVEDSTAPVARDMKEQVRMQLAAGKSEAEVKQYMTDRFGDFVLYKPPVKATTIALWAGPFVAMIFAGVLLVRRVRRSSTSPQPAVLSDADRERALTLLDQPTPVRDPKDTPAV